MVRLDALDRQWLVVSPSQVILSRAERLLRIHPLRAADAMQLAAALLATREEPETAHSTLPTPVSPSPLGKRASLWFNPNPFLGHIYGVRLAKVNIGSIGIV
jgi:hypothetical protein